MTDFLEWLKNEYTIEGSINDGMTPKLRMLSHGISEVTRLQAERAALLEALEVVDKWCDRCSEYVGGWVNHPEKPAQTPRDIVRAAIARAENSGG